MYFRALHHYLTAQDKNVINIASTGIAATLLVNGTTAHRKMMLPINMDANGRSKVNSGVFPSFSIFRNLQEFLSNQMRNYSTKPLPDDDGMWCSPQAERMFSHRV